MDVKELISVYGGIVMPEDPQPMVENAMEVVDKVWELSKTDSTSWNKSISNLKEFERKGKTKEDDLRMELDLKEAKEIFIAMPQYCRNLIHQSI